MSSDPGGPVEGRNRDVAVVYAVLEAVTEQQVEVITQLLSREPWRSFLARDLVVGRLALGLYDVEGGLKLAIDMVDTALDDLMPRGDHWSVSEDTVFEWVDQVVAVVRALLVRSVDA